mgnify:FL=1|jgi:hypothetical protein
MIIKGAKTIQEYKEKRDAYIQKWIDDRFFKNSVTWEMISPSEIKIVDRKGDSMIIMTDEI